MNDAVRDVVPVLSPANEAIITDYLTHGRPFFLEGGPGIGKSLSAKYYGRKVYEGLPRPVDSHQDWAEPIQIVITEDTEVRHLLGETNLVAYLAHVQSGEQPKKPVKDFFEYGPIPRGIMEGRLVIVEELDRAGRETLFPSLFDAIEYRRTYIPELGEEDGRIEAKGDSNAFNIVLTVNRFTDIGTVALPKALLRRPRRVELYDPSKETGLNRHAAIEHESRIIMANLERLVQGDADKRKRAESLTRRLLRDVVARLRGPDGMLEVPTPSETANWLVDLIECEPDLFAPNKTKADLLQALIHWRGAIVKSPDDTAVFVRIVTEHVQYAARE